MKKKDAEAAKNAARSKEHGPKNEDDLQSALLANDRRRREQNEEMNVLGCLRSKSNEGKEVDVAEEMQKKFDQLMMLKSEEVIGLKEQIREMRMN